MKVKYLLVGPPNTTKTTLAVFSGLSYFETDSLTLGEILSKDKYDLSKDVIIVGGKWRKYSSQIVSMLREALQGHKLILVKLEEL